MPHVNVKFFPRELTTEQQQALATALSDVIVQHLGSKESAVSVALQQVQPEAWKSQVWDTEIGPELESLAKKPGYSL